MLAHVQSPSLALLCWPGKIQDLAFWLLKNIRGMDSSPALMTLGPTFLPVVDNKRQWRGHLSLTHVTAWQSSGSSALSCICRWAWFVCVPNYPGQLNCADHGMCRVHSPVYCSWWRNYIRIIVLVWMAPSEDCLYRVLWLYSSLWPSGLERLLVSGLFLILGVIGVYAALE